MSGAGQSSGKPPVVKGGKVPDSAKLPKQYVSVTLGKGGQQLVEILKTQASLSAAEALLLKPDFSDSYTVPECAQAGLLTPVVKDAIPKLAAQLYFKPLAEEIGKHLNKTVQIQASFLCRLKAWLLLRNVVALAYNERPLTSIMTSLLDGNCEAAAKLIEAVPGQASAAKDIRTISATVKKIKTLEAALAKAQVSQANVQHRDWVATSVFDGKVERLLYWLGPVAVRPRVAKLANGQLTFPIPNVWVGTYSDGTKEPPRQVGKTKASTLQGFVDWTSMVFDAVASWGGNLLCKIEASAPALADYLTFSAYGVDGYSTASVVAFKAAVGLSDASLALGAGLAQVTLPVDQAAAFGPYATYKVGVLYDKAGIDSDDFVKTYPQFPDYAESIRAFHNQTRVKLAPMLEQIGQLQNNVSMAVVSGTGLPPVPIKWQLIGNLYGTAFGYQEWYSSVVGDKVLSSYFQKYNEQVGASGELSLTAFAEQIVYDDGNAPLVQALLQWEPGQPLLWASETADASRLALLKSLLDAAAKEWATYKPTGLDGGQLTWAKAQAGIKANGLLAAACGKLGIDRAGSVQELINNLQVLAMELYGIDIPPPPKGMDPGKFAEYYIAAFEKAANNPAPSSLLGQTMAIKKALLAVKDKAAAGDKQAIGELLALQAALVEAQAAQSVVMGKRRARRGLANMRLGASGETDGSTIGSVVAGSAYLAEAEKYAKATVVVGQDCSVTVTTTDKDKQIINDAKKQLQETADIHNASAGYVVGAGAGLKTAGENAGINLSPAFLDQVAFNQKAALGTLPEDSKGGFPWWLVLLGIVAAKHKGG